jgi:hypothetical protein
LTDYRTRITQVRARLQDLLMAETGPLNCTNPSYCEAIDEVYGPLPPGELWNDIAFLLAILPLGIIAGERT